MRETITVKTIDLIRFLKKTTFGDTVNCWVWTGQKNESGYAQFDESRQEGLVTTRLARWVYVIFCGDIPDKYEIDHMCSNRACVNPFHLQAVTHRENCALAILRKTHCKRNHRLSGHNIKSGSMACIECKRIRSRKWSRKNQKVKNVLKGNYVHQ